MTTKIIALMAAIIMIVKFVRGFHRGKITDMLSNGFVMIALAVLLRNYF